MTASKAKNVMVPLRERCETLRQRIIAGITNEVAELEVPNELAVHMANCAVRDYIFGVSYKLCASRHEEAEELMRDALTESSNNAEEELEIDGPPVL